MGSAVDRLARAGVVLPDVPAPVAAYVPVRRAGDLLFTAGQLPFVDGALLATGTVGTDVDVATARACARACGLNALAAVAAETGSVDAVRAVVTVTVFVASAPDFVDHPSVADGVSGLLAEVFGPAGEHARTAVGVAALPLGAPVEVAMVVEVGGADGR